mmetsp:Transcript_6875/g.5881  ORF Transcript_6875/g.5881 Transcript_6875/m.5881 type:complete len:231 (-) Transcript_6875:26-718(-)
MRRLLSARYPVEDLTCFVVERPSGDDEPRYWLTPQKGSPDDRQLSLGETVPATPSRLANRALVECEVLLARASPRFLGRLERVMDRAYVRTAIPGVIEGHEYLVLASLSAIFPRKLDYPGELINCLLLAISPAREGSSCRGSLEITELVYHENESLLYGSSQSNVSLSTPLLVKVTSWSVRFSCECGRPRLRKYFTTRNQGSSQSNAANCFTRIHQPFCLRRCIMVRSSH